MDFVYLPPMRYVDVKLHPLKYTRHISHCKPAKFDFWLTKGQYLGCWKSMVGEYCNCTLLGLRPMHPPRNYSYCVPYWYEYKCSGGENSSRMYAAFDECYQKAMAVPYCTETEYRKTVTVSGLRDPMAVLEYLKVRYASLRTDAWYWSCAIWIFPRRDRIKSQLIHYKYERPQVTVVKVYYPDPVITEINEIERYTAEMFISNICGQAGNHIYRLTVRDVI